MWFVKIWIHNCWDQLNISNCVNAGIIVKLNCNVISLQILNTQHVIIIGNQAVLPKCLYIYKGFLHSWMLNFGFLSHISFSNPNISLSLLISSCIPFTLLDVCSVCLLHSDIIQTSQNTGKMLTKKHKGWHPSEWLRIHIVML